MHYELRNLSLEFIAYGMFISPAKKIGAPYFDSQENTCFPMICMNMYNDRGNET